MEKIIYIKAYFIPIGKDTEIKVPTGETKKGLLGGEKQVFKKVTQWQQTGYSDCVVDSKRLAVDLQAITATLNKEGYSIKTILPVISGHYDYRYQAENIYSSKRVFSDTEKISGGASFGYGYGYSYTDSLILVAEKKEDNQ